MLRYLRAWVVIVLLAGGSSVLSAPIAAEDEASDEDWEPLYNLVDPALQARLEAAIKTNTVWQRLVQRKKLAVCVVDLSTDPPHFARVNGNTMMYAASLPKIAILLAAYASFDDGSLQETPELHADLIDMIRVSSNAAATRVAEAVTLPKIEAVLRDPQFGLYDETRGGGLWMGKAYAKTGPRYGDPMYGISHGATATQVCRFYYLAATGRLISPERSAQILGDLSEPGLHHKFVGAVEQRQPEARLFRKSGTWKDWHSDSIMVLGPDWRNYILVGLVESPDGEKIIRNLLPMVEEILQE
jgi:beta-lactamase class A